MDLFEKCEKFTAAREAMREGYYPYFTKIDSAQDPIVKVGGRKMLMIGSNDYLGLATHPKLKEAAKKAIKKYGVGCTGSRFLNGTLDIHVKLEEKIADFEGKEAALVYTTGVLTNMGTISSLVAKNDVVITDRLDHASIIDGCRLAFGTMKRFRHNDMKDLERILSSIGEPGGRLIVVDGVFSMEGDIAKLPEIVQLAKKYNARVMVDDAHAVGVLGKNGTGTSEHFGLVDDVDIIMGTCSKSLASIGGFVVGREDVIHYLKHFSRTMIFSASLPPPSVASISAAIDIIKSEPERKEQLWKNTRKMKEGFEAIGYDTGVSETPIIPLVIGDEMKVLMMRRILFDNGIFANPVLPPATPQGRALIRTSYMATHRDRELDFALEVFEKVGKKLGVIKGKPATYLPRQKRRIRLKARIRKIRKGAKVNIRKWMGGIYK